MFKILKKYSKLLALALVFSSSIPFASFATAPQEPNKPTAAQAQKREREEYSSEEVDITEEYNLAGLIGPFYLNSGSDKANPRCGLPVIHNSCNRRVRHFYLLPDYDHNVIAIGRGCLKSNFGAQAHKIAYRPEKARKYIIIKKILSYFLGKNWYISCNDNFVLDLTPLLSDPELQDVIKCNNEYFTIYFNSEPTKENPNCYNMAYEGDRSKGCKGFSKKLKLGDDFTNRTLADKKFAAFCKFCKMNEIL